MCIKRNNKINPYTINEYYEELCLCNEKLDKDKDNEIFKKITKSN
jgi:hypothetical protein